VQPKPGSHLTKTSLTPTVFRAGNTLRKLATVPAVASVYAYQGGFLDVGTHRLWIRARPSNNPAMILSSQLVEGDLTTATRHLREGGWATLRANI